MVEKQKDKKKTKAMVLEKGDIWYCPECGFNLPKSWKFDRCMMCGAKRDDQPKSTKEKIG